MRTTKSRVLIAEDDSANMGILDRHLSKAGYEITAFPDGEHAWKYLQKNAAEVDVVLLDKRMPNMDGMAFLQKMRQANLLSTIPVIMQTAAIGNTEIVEGMEAGAYYYLTKPYSSEMLLSLVNAAIRNHLRKEIKEERKNYQSFQRHISGALKEATFTFRTIEEAQSVSLMLAQYFPSPHKASLALSALMVNAVEHGNLEIGYHLKQSLVETHAWEKEVAARLDDPKYRFRSVRVQFFRDHGEINITIRDDGFGFDWKHYTHFDPLTLLSPHGRGIAMSRIMGFTAIDYSEAGSKVVCSYIMDK